MRKTLRSKKGDQDFKREKEQQELARKTSANKYSLVLGKELKIGDRIIHNYCSFIITNYGFGKFAGSIEFGEYICIEGRFINPNQKDDQIVKNSGHFKSAQ